MATPQALRAALDAVTVRHGGYSARQRDIAHGLKRLREARALFGFADCPATLKKIRRAIDSAEGAARNAARFPFGRPARTRAARLARRAHAQQ